MLDKLKTLLGLSDSAPEAEVVAKVETLKAENETLKARPVVAAKEILDAAGAAPTDDAPAVAAKVAAFKTAAAGKTTTDADFMALKADHEVLKQSLALRDRDDAVASALAAGKIAPAQKAWADAYALKDPAGFDAFVAKAPQVVPLKDLPGKKDAGPSGATAEERLDKLTVETAKAKSIGYKAAWEIVCKENPELAKEMAAEKTKKAE